MGSPLFRLVYISRGVRKFDLPELLAMLNTFRAANMQHDITGMLLYYNSDFMQLLKFRKKTFWPCSRTSKVTCATIVLPWSCAKASSSVISPIGRWRFAILLRHRGPAGPATASFSTCRFTPYHSGRRQTGVRS